jgi:hypothetical protein
MEYFMCRDQFAKPQLSSSFSSTLSAMAKSALYKERPSPQLSINPRQSTNHGALGKSILIVTS